MLAALWKWKALNTASVATEFFGSPLCDHAYRRVRRLARAGLVCLEPIRRWLHGDVWILTLQGFANVQEGLPEMKEAGFRSEALAHDYLCTAVQRGPWLGAIPAGVELVSEQELRRLGPDHLPSWVPSTEIHRPDGYSRLPVKGRAEIVSFEVELSCKHESFYRTVARFYHDTQSVFRVIWMVPTASAADRIQAMLGRTVPQSKRLHDFVLLPDFLKQGWHARFVLGYEAGRPLTDLLENGVSPPCLPGDSLLLLNLRKRPYKSKDSKSRTKAPFRNRLVTTVQATQTPVPQAPFKSLQLSIELR